MDLKTKNNNDFLLLAGQSSKRKEESDTDSESESESDSESVNDMNIIPLLSNLSVNNTELNYEIKFNVKQINEITECDFSKGYLFPIKTQSVKDYLKIEINEENDSTEYKVKKEGIKDETEETDETKETEESNEKIYKLYYDETPSKEAGVYVDDSEKNDIFVNNSVAFTHKKKE